jgi:hypothetical protein
LRLSTSGGRHIQFIYAGKEFKKFRPLLDISVLMKATNLEGEKGKKYSEALPVISYSYRAGTVVFT